MKFTSPKLINVVNDRFGTDFNDAGQLFFDQIVEAALPRARGRLEASSLPLACSLPLGSLLPPRASIEGDKIILGETSY